MRKFKVAGTMGVVKAVVSFKEINAIKENPCTLH